MHHDATDLGWYVRATRTEATYLDRQRLTAVGQHLRQAFRPPSDADEMTELLQQIESRADRRN